jgi:putative DNA primase/helicase
VSAEWEFVQHLAKLAPIFTASPGGSEFHRPDEWQQTPLGADWFAGWQDGDAICAVQGGTVAVVDVDPRNGGDVQSVRQLLDGLSVQVFAEDATPGEGRHFFIAGHPELASVHATGDRPGLIGYPGVDIQSHGTNVFLPGTKRPKYSGKGYTVVFDNLEALADGGDPVGAETFAGWVADNRISKQEKFEPSQPWDGTPPDARRAAYLAAALHHQHERIAGMKPDSGRNTAIYNAALACGNYIAGAGLDKQEAITTLLKAANHCRLVADDGERSVLASIRSGISNGQNRPRAVPDDPQPNPGRYFNKDDGLLVATLAGDILKIGPLAEGIDDIMWSYSGGVWTPDKHVARTRTATLLGERYRRTHGVNVEDVARTLAARIACDPIPEVINFTNGLYYWKLEDLRPHTPDVLTTVQLAVDYDPLATCPEFDRFLTQVLPADMVPVVWEVIGYLMYSGNPLHKAVMLMGRGRNGKGTFLRTMNALLGERNVTSVSLQDLVNTRFSTASLFGKIANIAGDIDGTYLESTATFKAITGQDMISAEHKGRDRFDFTPWAVPVFSANKIPASSDVTTGYLSRWLVVPFPHDFTGREDRHLDQRLQTKAELTGIAAKAMPALRRLLGRGEFDIPASGEQALDEFTRRVDQVRTWVDECCELHPDAAFVTRTTLYNTYKGWAERDGYRAVKAGEFYDRLQSVPGCAHTRIHGGTRGFTGLLVTDHAERW